MLPGSRADVEYVYLVASLPALELTTAPRIPAAELLEPLRGS